VYGGAQQSHPIRGIAVPIFGSGKLQSGWSSNFVRKSTKQRRENNSDQCAGWSTTMIAARSNVIGVRVAAVVLPRPLRAKATRQLLCQGLLSIQAVLPLVPPRRSPSPFLNSRTFHRHHFDIF